jgi:hypothetical protein
VDYSDHSPFLAQFKHGTFTVFFDPSSSIWLAGATYSIWVCHLDHLKRRLQLQPLGRAGRTIQRVTLAGLARFKIGFVAGVTLQ